MEFFTQLFTSKRGSLARIWLAAHWEKKITKAHVYECNLEITIKDIISPQIKIGLRTSGHLLLGVVRIYSRKAKYLLADCNDAVVKIKIAFRPGQTDLPLEGMEAMVKAITLPEVFTDFESQLPELNTIDVVDHFSLNQSRTEEITLRENFENSFLTMDDFGAETQSHKGLFDSSFHSLGLNSDGFGDEGMNLDLVDFICNANENAVLSDSYEDCQNPVPAAPPPSAINESASESFTGMIPTLDSSVLNETTLLVNVEEGFALEPVPITPSSDRKKGSRKRKLVVDLSKQLSNESIRAQLDDCSDLLTSLDLAPPTRQLMEWKENGGVEYLFSHFCITVMHADLQELLPKQRFSKRWELISKAGEGFDPEESRERSREESSAVSMEEEISFLPELMDQSIMTETSSVIEPSVMNRELPECNVHLRESRLEPLYPDTLSEESMLVHTPGVETDTLIQTQQPAVNSQDVVEKQMTMRAQNLFQTLKKQKCSANTSFSLHALCENSSRHDAAATFFSLLVLKKHSFLDLHQNAPYCDITITPGPHFS